MSNWEIKIRNSFLNLPSARGLYIIIFIVLQLSKIYVEIEKQPLGDLFLSRAKKEVHFFHSFWHTSNVGKEKWTFFPLEAPTQSDLIEVFFTMKK